MAARVARAAGKLLIRLHSGGVTQCIRANVVQQVYVIKGLGNSARSISQFPRAPQSSQTRTHYQEDVDNEEEDLEYEVGDDELEKLRKEHRSIAKGSHASQDGKQFSDFPLDPVLMSRLDALGYAEPFEIQATTLEHTLAGRDVIARALTGSGKTLAFSIPIVHKLLQRGQNRRSNQSPKAIVISPTRELCMQIYRSIQELDSRVRCVPVYGGASINVQEHALRRGVDVVCATPGRLNDHLERGIINLDQLEFLCLDEADELLTPGFKEQIQNVLETAPDGRQVMLFSATMPPHIKAITSQYMNEAVAVDITANQRYKAPESVKHLCMKVPASQRLFMVRSLLEEHRPERCIVFMETKRATSSATQMLRHKMGFKADGISSDLSQRKRENIMAAFRAGTVKVLVATDVAARGLDIPEVDLVIQVTPPRNGTEYYIHRSGRTGRAGREGLSVLLHDGSRVDRQTLWEIEKLAKLEHVQPPNQGEMVEQVARQMLAKLQKQTKSRVAETLLPIVQELNLTVEGANQLLAAALSDSVVSTESSEETETRSEGTYRGGYRQDRQRSTQRFGKKPGYGYGQRRHQQHGGQGLWDEDEYGQSSMGSSWGNNSRKRTVHRGAGSSDWSKFY